MKNNKQGNPEFIGQRLLTARKMAGFTLQELAQKMDIEISKQALSQFEKGQSKPTHRVLLSLSNAINLPVHYFFKALDVRIGDVEFRQYKNLPKKILESLTHKAIDYIDKYCEIEEILNIESAFTNPLIDSSVKNNKDIEKRALEIREAWSLGLEPVADVIRLLELKGIKILEVDMPLHFSGMSSLTDGIAVIIINKNKKITATRKRLTALHELAHLAITFPKNMDQNEIEKLCFDFAAAFLVPEKVLLNEFGKKHNAIQLDEIIIIENYYGISVQAFMKRASRTGIISKSQFMRYNKWLKDSKRKNEIFGNFAGLEKTVRFRELVLKAMSMKIITLSKAAALLDIPPDRLKNEITYII